MVEQEDVSIELKPMEQEEKEESLNIEVDAAPAPAPSPAPAAAAALKEEPLKNNIAFNIASAILHCMRTTFDNDNIYKDTIKSGYIQGIVKTKLNTITITQQHATEIFKLIEQMKITLAKKKIVGGNVEYTFTFDLHDSKGYFTSNSSRERCSGIRIFIELIKDLKDELTKGDGSKLFENIGISNNDSIVVSAEIEYSGKSLQQSISLCRTKGKFYGGSKSRCRPARKTRRGRGRTRKSKPKSKSKRHSLTRKHKKYTRKR
jgi:hypothetical protein